MSTLKQKTLEIFPENEEKTYEILSSEAGLYGDNGAESDGNTLFPSTPLENDKVVQAGYGVYRMVCYYNDDFSGISAALESRHETTPEHYAEIRGSDTVEYEDVVDALTYTRITYRWCGFGNGDVVVVEW